ncbi:MAG: symmetrical bis(5'-nucleosyl)-tetraphosphatase [Cocleimonas sp.]|nr:symmetrical bis(5'-nucleosyl)-tetraphosphatase [Cocleimonas sp.]
MAIYAIGDLQGCYDSLQQLLEKLEFSPEKDQLWFAGDLVNRGKKSLKTLRFVKSLGDSATVVLGNHDITLLAMHYGVLRPNASLKKLLKAKDADELMDWLRNRPMLHVDESLGFCMVHAGISPEWTLKKAQKYAKEMEVPLRSASIKVWLENVYGNKPRRWSKTLESYARHRYILNSFTRMRYCDKKDGALNFSLKGPPVYQSKMRKRNKKVPWFLWKKRKKIPLRIIFGHWSSLGYYQDENVIALDTGCVWGGQLTAIRLDRDIVTAISQPCRNKV